MVIFLSIGVLLFACLPGFVWLSLFLKEDIHPEPKSLVVKTFGIGALITLFVLGLELIFQFSIGPSYSKFAFYSMLTLALLEELGKFFAGYFYIRKKPEFDEPVDAMIYMMAISLGFATVENIFIVSSYIFSPHIISLFDVGETVALRFIGATLLHTLTGAIMGYFWAKGILKRTAWKYIFAGLLIVVGIHFTFNYLIVLFQSINMLYPTIFLVAVSFFVLKDFEKIKEE